MTTYEPTADPDLAEVPTEELFRRLRRDRSRAVRNELVHRHLGLAYSVANRYRNRGVAREDLNQVAMLALVKAVNRYDPDHGAALSTYASRTIHGEIKRHFRDRTWRVSAPRSVKQASVKVRKGRTALEHQLGRSPTVSELSAHLDMEPDDVIQALTANSAYRPDSINTSPTDADDDGVRAQDRRPQFAEAEEGFDVSEAKVVTDRLLQVLAPREQEIVRLRFFEGLSQAKIGERVGVSQMQVSRLLRQSFEAMREAARQQTGPQEGFTASTTVRMPPDVAEVGPTRSKLHRWLQEAGVPEHHADNVRLVISELLTNAVEQDPPGRVTAHAGVSHDGTAVVVRVSNVRTRADTLPDRDQWRPEELLAARGRGLMITDALCSDVEWRDNDASTTVSARYELPDDPVAAGKVTAGAGQSA